jgi:hypothetical protein
MPRESFEPMIPVFERSKTERALDTAVRGTIVILYHLIVDSVYVKFVGHRLKDPNRPHI